jgi:excisionase family DNA binding protein
MHPPALTLKDFCDAYRVCRETAYQQIRTGRLRAVKLGRKTLILRADAEVWAASLPELRTVGREQARTAVTAHNLRTKNARHEGGQIGKI